MDTLGDIRGVLVGVVLLLLVAVAATDCIDGTVDIVEPPKLAPTTNTTALGSLLVAEPSQGHNKSVERVNQSVLCQHNHFDIGV